MSDDVLRDTHFRELTASLKALASEPSDQLALFPASNTKAGDLASRFDDSARVICTEYQGDLSRPQVDALASLVEWFDTMSRDGAEFDPTLWTEDAVKTSEHWREVRVLARAALDAFSDPV
jgi:hypothetical protein